MSKGSLAPIELCATTLRWYFLPGSSPVTAYRLLKTRSATVNQEAVPESRLRMT